jgi:hypothetical protein
VGNVVSGNTLDGIARDLEQHDLVDDVDDGPADHLDDDPGRVCIQYAHRLRGLAARKKAAAEVREPLASEADAIKADASTLRRNLACPRDASST